MAEFPRGGVVAALHTPTDGHGRIQKRALELHLGWLRARGVHGVLALGSTGEFPQFTLDERLEILSEVVAAAGDLPVLVNASDIRPGVAIEIARYAAQIGLSGVALMPPSFYPSSDADQEAFFVRVAKTARIPILLYNFPELCGNRIAPGTVDRVARQVEVLGLKQSGGEFEYHQELVALGEKHGFPIFSGADTRLTEAFAVGAAGCIGGLVNFIPEPMLEIHAAAAAGKTAPEAAARMRAVGALVDRVTFPLNIPAGMKARRLACGRPKSIVSAESARLAGRLTTDLRRLFTTWGLE